MMGEKAELKSAHLNNCDKDPDTDVINGFKDNDLTTYSNLNQCKYMMHSLSSQPNFKKPYNTPNAGPLTNNMSWWLNKTYSAMERSIIQNYDLTVHGIVVQMAKKIWYIL